MLRTVLSLYIVLTLFGMSLAYAAPAESPPVPVQDMTTSMQTTVTATAKDNVSADAQDKTTGEEGAQPAVEPNTDWICAPPDDYDDFTSADWAYVTRDENSSTYLRMDTIKHTRSGDVTISCGDIKKTYTKHGLTSVYYSLKATADQDDESLALLKEIDHAIMHVSYRQVGSTIAHRLHRTTFYNKSGNIITVFDFDDLALQTGAHLIWTPVTSRMDEEIAIFCRLANG